MTTRRVTLRLGAAAGALLLVVASATAQTAKKELVQKILQAQQSEIEGVARSIVERPAAQMMQEASLAIERQIPADKREAVGRAIEVEVKKYVDESYPQVRERALRVAPTTIGAALEEKMSEDELKLLLAWLQSPVNKKYQQLGPEMRNAFIQKLLADARPVIDPKVQALDMRIRALLGLPPAPTGAAVSGPGANPAARPPAVRPPPPPARAASQ